MPSFPVWHRFLLPPGTFPPSPGEVRFLYSPERHRFLLPPERCRFLLPVGRDIDDFAPRGHPEIHKPGETALQWTVWLAGWASEPILSHRPSRDAMEGIQKATGWASDFSDDLSSARKRLANKILHYVQNDSQ